MQAGVSVGEVNFKVARRVNRAFTADAERRLLVFLAERAPAWITSDGLTGLGLTAQVGAGACFAAARFGRLWLLGVVACIVLNWLGDSLDGTLARVRGQQRPRFGFYVDHMVDLFGGLALMGGLACSGMLHPWVAWAMLVAFLLLSSESYLATYTLGNFEMSQGRFGPTEIRLLLIAGTLKLLRGPWVTVAGHRVMLFDLGGTVAVIAMLGMAAIVTVRHTAQLYREEPLP